MSIEETLAQILQEVRALKPNGNGKPTEDHLITAKEAAKMLGVSPRYLYQQIDSLTYAVRLSPTVVRFSWNLIQAEISKRLRAKARDIQ